MKIWPVFSFVLVVHVLIIGLFLVQPGCQSRPSRADPEMTTRQEDPVRTETPSRPLDPAFNGELEAARRGSSRPDLSAPSRPEGMRRSAPESDGLEPVLEPVRESVPSTVASRNYTVQRGDTLSGIARRNDIPLGELLAVNGLEKDSTIYVGQELLLPDISANAAESEEGEGGEAEQGGREVEVRRGDTLSAIARRNDTTVAALRGANNLSGDTIYVGQSLTVPEDNASAAAPSDSSADRSDSGRRHIVQAGETPSAIAKRYGVSTRELMRLNNIRDARKLYVGQELRIPGEGGDAGDASAPPERATFSAGSPTSAASADESGSSAPPSRQSEQSRPVAESSGGRESPEESPTSEEGDSMSALEALENEELPFVEVEESGPDEENNAN